MTDQISIKGARLHNLKNISLDLPKKKLIVLTGLSGSGKSTLAFDIINKEGQRQYMESLGLVTDTLNKPQIDSISGLSPSISVDQNLTNRSPRSTVGTATEVYTYLRVLYARLGHRPCPRCGEDVPPSYAVNGESVWDEGEDGGEATEFYPCPHCGELIMELGMANFSFNKPAGACPTCTGLGNILDADLGKLIDPGRSLLQDAVLNWDRFTTERAADTLQAAGKYYGFQFDPDQPIQDLGPVQRDLLLYGGGSPRFRRHFPDIEPPPTVRQGYFEGIVTNLLRRYSERISDADYREKIEKMLVKQVCPDCNGERLRPESRSVTVAGRSIVEIARLPLIQLADWMERLAGQIPPEATAIYHPIIADLRERVRRLVDVGVGYLTLERSSPTLSAGEAQRLRLASLLGSGLTDVLYVLDEPTIGLHPRDTARLIRVMSQLRDLGNTVLVIEHDLEVMCAADHLVDIGPGGGREGGQIVAAGTPAEVAENSGSITGAFLAGRECIPLPERRRACNGKYLTIHDAREHNLKGVTARIPLGTLTAVTGVSGSGKSSLMFDILDRAARRHYYGASEAPGLHGHIEGWEHLDKIITIDQSPIGRSTRSNAATYTDAFTAIRDVFAAQPEARRRGLQPRHFSFNVPGGRCERCEGAGALTVEMHFLSDVQVRCPVCHGRRFKREILAVKYNGLDVAGVLDMTIKDAAALFQSVPAVSARLDLMTRVGLGYLQLGQPATTLSGGEAQRVKLAKELARRAVKQTLYLLDEPTTGLHPADIAHLLHVLQGLVDAGNTVVVVEHNLDVIKTADWVIDLGPEGGEAGGQIVAEGTPEQVAQVAASHTGKYLRAVLK